MSELKKFASRMYMRSMVLVNTAASSSAGSLTMTEDGHFGPVSLHRYNALDTPIPEPIWLQSIESISQPRTDLNHA